MAIIVNLDVMLAKREITVKELSEKVGITMANISICIWFHYLIRKKQIDTTITKKLLTYAQNQL